MISLGWVCALGVLGAAESAGRPWSLSIESGLAIAADAEPVPPQSPGFLVGAKLVVDLAALSTGEPGPLSVQVGGGWFGFPGSDWRGAAHGAVGVRYSPPAVAFGASPYVDADLGLARSGARVHPLVSLSAGFDLDVDQIRLGPFVRYAQLTNRGDDIQVFLVGLATGMSAPRTVASSPITEQPPAGSPAIAAPQMPVRCPELPADRVDPVLDSTWAFAEKHGGAPGCGSPGAECEPRLILPSRVFFSRDQDVLEPGEEKVLDFIASYLASHPEIERLRVEGHTDETGGADLNTALSLKRGRAVVAELVRRGIAESRLVVRGYGSSRPAVLAQSEDVRRFNRRVEFVVVPAPTAP
jgi:outer membrane protein OmpA-like peptidoglycan-associated protein